MGRVLLAGLRPDELGLWLAGARMEKLTDVTVTDPGKLAAIVTRARRDGYATASDELDYGITAIAVPIHDAEGRVVAALNSSGYSGRVGVDQMIDERLAELRESAARISHGLVRYPALAHSLGGDGGRAGRPLAARAKEPA
jgi:IclR family pca regulon transcriptional regulator